MMDYNWDHFSWVFLQAVLYIGLGLVVLAVVYWLINKLTVFSLHTEIIDNKNLALAVLLGAVVISVALIVAAAIHS
jgi:putative membrane protein